MFKTIFAFETKRWFKDYKFYLYFIIFFGLSFLMMATSVGYFDALSATTASNLKMNSPMMINAFISQISHFINLIIPPVFVATIYRDFKSNTHSFLYSYPFGKEDYILGKFFSGFVATILITFSVGLAFLIATLLPFANAELLGPVNLWAYFQSYVIFVIPNIFFIDRKSVV